MMGERSALHDAGGCRAGLMKIVVLVSLSGY